MIETTLVGLGERLRSARHSCGLKQRELSSRTGISQKAISDVENGYRDRPYLSTLKKLSDELGVSVSYLMGGKAGEVKDRVLR